MVPIRFLVNLPADPMFAALDPSGMPGAASFAAAMDRKRHQADRMRRNLSGDPDP